MPLSRPHHSTPHAMPCLAGIGVWLVLAVPGLTQPTLEELQPAIDDALHRGVDALLREQQADGTWPDDAFGYPVGPTALCTYTLLRCGLSAEHPGVERALRYLETHLSVKTYGAACQLMALEATHDPKYKPQLEILLKRLLGWQRGGFGYPHGDLDLSNTQYAALGFRAARLAGLQVPRGASIALVDETIAHQERARSESLPRGPADHDEYERSAKGRVAGFRYRPESRDATGSMTTAGLGTLLICQDLMGRKAPGSLRKKIAAAVDAGSNWMRVNWSVEKNPNDGGSNHHYYLYGLERVGDLLRTNTFAGHFWYREGADWLVRHQDRESGQWEGTIHTCFGLLFLKRATWQGSLTNTAGMDRTQRVYLAASDEADVVLRGAGNPVISLWIGGFHPGRLQKRFPTAKEPGNALHVSSVEYLVDGAVVHAAAGDVSKPWAGEAFAYQHHFSRRGRYAVTARVHVKNPDGDPDAAPTLRLDAPLMMVEVQDLADPSAEKLRLELLESLLYSRRLRIETSSHEHGDPGDGQRPWISDGRLATHWRCKKTDENPWIRVTLPKLIKLRTLSLWPAVSLDREGQNQFDTIEQVEVRVDKRLKATRVTAPPDHAPLRLDFGRRTDLRTVEIRITRRTPSKRERGVVGFAEITASL